MEHLIGALFGYFVIFFIVRFTVRYANKELLQEIRQMLAEHNIQATKTIDQNENQAEEVKEE